MLDAPTPAGGTVPHGALSALSPSLALPSPHFPNQVGHGAGQSGAGYRVFAAPDREPTTEILAEAIEAARDRGADFIPGIKGGSAIYIVKLVAALADGAQMLDEIVGIGLLCRRPLPLSCAPTTAGMGSEQPPFPSWRMRPNS